MTTPIEIVRAWQSAVNEQDSKRLTELSDPNIEIVGPRGSAYGHPILQDWLNRAGLSLETQRSFAKDAKVVVAQHAIWRDPQTRETIGEADVASYFQVKANLVVFYARYDSLEIALEKAGLQDSDEIN